MPSSWQSTTFASPANRSRVEGALPRPGLGRASLGDAAAENGQARWGWDCRGGLAGSLDILRHRPHFHAAAGAAYPLYLHLSLLLPGPDDAACAEPVGRAEYVLCVTLAFLLTIRSGSPAVGLLQTSVSCATFFPSTSSL